MKSVRRLITKKKKLFRKRKWLIHHVKVISILEEHFWSENRHSCISIIVLCDMYIINVAWSCFFKKIELSSASWFPHEMLCPKLIVVQGGTIQSTITYIKVTIKYKILLPLSKKKNSNSNIYSEHFQIKIST